MVASSTLEFAHEQTTTLKEKEQTGEIDGAPTEIDVSREEVAQALCDLGTQHETNWLDELLGRRGDEVDAIVERSETIVQGACNT